MRVKVLWFKEFQQVKGLLWVVLGAMTAAFVTPVAQQLSRWTQLAARGHHLEALNLSINIGLPSLLLPLLAITLACVQIGSERSHGRDYFTFALPYSRPVIFLTKWSLGAVTFITTLALSGFIVQFLISSSSAAASLVVKPALWPHMVQLAAATLAVYTLVLFIGTLTGNAAYQAILGTIFGIFPIGLLLLLLVAVDIHMMALTGASGRGGASVWVRWLGEVFAPYLSVLTHFGDISRMGVTWDGWYSTAMAGWTDVLPLAAADLVLVAALLVGGAYLYSRNRLEYNGRMLVIPGARLFFTLGITVCFALLGGFGFVVMEQGWWNRGLGVQSLFAYYAGALIAGGLAYYFTRKALWPLPAGGHDKMSLAGLWSRRR